MAQSKDDIRKAALKLRDGLDSAWRAQASAAMASHADAIDATPHDIIAGFWPIRSEADPRALMDYFAARGNLMALPVVIDKQTIIFRQAEKDTALIAAGFGTFGPPDTAPMVDPTILLMPLSAYDRRGNRIGYGAGHYDRAIAKLIANLKRPRLFGIAFACQRVDAVPAEAHDVPLDGIITENGLTLF
jgi:5-formyltetrahydrofolate cyclo-ligase